jgi:hypothetical protein
MTARRQALRMGCRPGRTIRIATSAPAGMELSTISAVYRGALALNREADDKKHPDPDNERTPRENKQ